MIPINDSHLTNKERTALKETLETMGLLDPKKAQGKLRGSLGPQLQSVYKTITGRDGLCLEETYLYAIKNNQSTELQEVNWGRPESVKTDSKRQIRVRKSKSGRSN